MKILPAGGCGVVAARRAKRRLLVVRGGASTGAPHSKCVCWPDGSLLRGEDFWSAGRWELATGAPLFGIAFSHSKPHSTAMEDSWPHAPPHFLHEPGTYMVTARTYQSQHHFGSRLRLRYLTAELLRYAANNGWKIEAWAVLANHYHWVGKSPNAGAGNLGSWLGELHAITAGHVNRLDKTTGRKVWHNYRESLITYEKSYLARLRYVMQNPVKHGLVERAEDYPWCSASWFSENASLAFQKSLAGFKINRLNIDDDD